MENEMRMRNLDVNRLQEFLRKVNICEGEIIIKLDEGTALNVKSMLSKIIFAAVMDKSELIRDAIVICELEKDRSKLLEFIQQ